jgi:hypothetical protein
MGSQHVHQVPSSSLLYPISFALSSTLCDLAQKQKITTYLFWDVQSLIFFGDGPITKERYWTLGPHYQLNKSEYIYIPTTHPLKKGYWFRPCMVTTSFRNRNCMEPMRWLYMQSRGVIFFPWGQRRGRGAGVYGWNFLIFVFSSCSQCVPACSQLCFSIFQCVPQSTTHLSHFLCPKVLPSPLLPYVGGPKRRYSIFTQKLLFWGNYKGQVFFNTNVN